MNNVTENNLSTDGLQLLIEVRTRLIRWLFVFLIIFCIFLYYANELYSDLASPLIKMLPGKHLIATQMISPFTAPFRLVFFLAVVATMPLLIYQVWAFISPALYQQEKRKIWPLLAISITLFYLGMAFAYFIIFPMLFYFLTYTTPIGVLMSPDINEYLDFTIKFLLLFGVLFEIPIVMALLVLLQIIQRTKFIEFRRYAIVGAFIIGMLLAPPDVISQTILAVSMWLLYELGVLISSFIAKKRN